MATRARIGIKNADGTVTSMYVHSDGYAKKPGAGWELFHSYTTRELAEALVARGELRRLDSTLEVSQGYDNGGPPITHPMNEWPTTGQEHEYLFVSMQCSSTTVLPANQENVPLINLLVDRPTFGKLELEADADSAAVVLVEADGLLRQVPLRAGRLVVYVPVQRALRVIGQASDQDTQLRFVFSDRGGVWFHRSDGAWRLFGGGAPIEADWRPLDEVLRG